MEMSQMSVELLHSINKNIAFIEREEWRCGFEKYRSNRDEESVEDSEVKETIATGGAFDGDKLSSKHAFPTHIYHTHFPYPDELLVIFLSL